MPSDPLFLTGSGAITGWRDGAVIRATGIRYAVAERWQPPRRAPAGPQRATGWSPACPQLPIRRLSETLPGAFDRLGFDEDCLRLSITRPVAGSALPVMVWIHGGSYEAGAGDMSVFDPAVLAAEQRVVVVAVTYRLGLLGWLHGWQGDARDVQAANLGLQDLVAALDWVAENIAAFGGDPDRVTLFGQSSGGDVIARLLHTRAAALFRRAIIQSAPLQLQEGGEPMRRAMRRAARGLSPHDPIDAVLARQARVARSARRFGLAGQMPFGPDPAAPPFHPPSGRRPSPPAPRQDLLIGHTRDEAALFLPPAESPLLRLAEPMRRQAVRALTARLYGRPARRLARHHAAGGGRAQLFEIEWAGGRFGRAHLSELPLLFPHPDWIGSPLVPDGMDLETLVGTGRRLRAIWAGFARDGRVAGDVAGLIRFSAG